MQIFIGGRSDTVAMFGRPKLERQSAAAPRVLRFAAKRWKQIEPERRGESVRGGVAGTWAAIESPKPTHTMCQRPIGVQSETFRYRTANRRRSCNNAPVSSAQQV